MAIILLYSIYVVKLTINMSNLHHVCCFLLAHLWVVALFTYYKYLKAQSLIFMQHKAMKKTLQYTTTTKDLVLLMF